MTGPVYRERQVRKARREKPALRALRALRSVLIRHIGNERDLPRALDRGLQLALVHRARARDPPRQDLAALGDERADQLHVLVVDVVDLVRAELAHLPAAEQR